MKIVISKALRAFQDTEALDAPAATRTDPSGLGRMRSKQTGQNMLPGMGLMGLESEQQATQQAEMNAPPVESGRPNYSQGNLFGPTPEEEQMSQPQGLTQGIPGIAPPPAAPASADETTYKFDDSGEPIALSPAQNTAPTGEEAQQSALLNEALSPNGTPAAPPATTGQAPAATTDEMTPAELAQIQNDAGRYEKASRLKQEVQRAVDAVKAGHPEQAQLIRDQLIQNPEFKSDAVEIERRFMDWVNRAYRGQPADKAQKITPGVEQGLGLTSEKGAPTGNTGAAQPAATQPPPATGAAQPPPPQPPAPPGNQPPTGGQPPQPPTNNQPAAQATPAAGGAAAGGQVDNQTAAAEAQKDTAEAKQKARTAEDFLKAVQQDPNFFMLWMNPVYQQMVMGAYQQMKANEMMGGLAGHAGMKPEDFQQQFGRGMMPWMGNGDGNDGPYQMYGSHPLDYTMYMDPRRYDPREMAHYYGFKPGQNRGWGSTLGDWAGNLVNAPRNMWNAYHKARMPVQQFTRQLGQGTAAPGSAEWGNRGAQSKTKLTKTASKKLAEVKMQLTKYAAKQCQEYRTFNPPVLRGLHGSALFTVLMNSH